MKRIVTVAAALVVASSFSAFAEGDAVKGKKVFNKCKACHAVGEKAKNKVGPILNGVIDREWGEVEGYKYSKPLLAGKEEGKVWDAATLDAYLIKPKDVIPKGKMAFAGLKKEADRQNVIAYLSGFNADGTEK
ncbi:MAG: cytochrome c family protein [Stappiaceae bacterium]